jgi:translation initiation factor 2B subunit (eIF-2B alpha/beta/delta family)
MPSQALLDEFYRSLDQSKSFQLLPQEQQLELKKNFAAADDSQIVLGMEALKKNEQVRATAEAETQRQEQKLVELAENLKLEMKQIAKAELEEAEKVDTQESSQAADEILTSLKNVKSSPGQSAKRKKFLGIF